MNNFNTNEALRCLKQINDCNRCLICDKLDGRRVRFKCGHVTCNKCAEDLNECDLCIFNNVDNPLPKLDESATGRAENAALLTKSFETVFGVDLKARIRLSEQLKVEREVFPRCIQAPTKYFNKTKAVNLSLKSRKNSYSLLLDEDIFLNKSVKMQRSSYVQQWLEQNEKVSFDRLPRIPLGSLDVNSPRALSKTSLSFRKFQDLCNTDQNEDYERNKTKKRKSIAINFTDKKRTKFKDEHLVTKENKQNETNVNNIEKSSLLTPIVIEDSECENIVDKDREALLAVMRAEEQASNLAFEEPYQKISEQSVQKHIPFYKKGPFVEPCIYCTTKMPENTYENKSKSVCITIENNSFSTIINVSNVSGSNLEYCKASVYVQTDISCLDDKISRSISNLRTENYTDIVPVNKQVIFENANPELENLNAQTKVIKSVAIADSDSDDNTDQSYKLEVKAEVHNSNEQLFNGILIELDPYNLQPRRGNINRAVTPTSSNSSEKENFDPNKSKRTKFVKKKK